MVIIGAGAAGIAASTRLYENGIKDIVLLEAENRIGGRVNTVDIQSKSPSSYIIIACFNCSSLVIFSYVSQMES